jgi:polyphosphate glucokinase
MTMGTRSSKTSGSVIAHAPAAPVTLSIDVGGSGLKAELLDSAGKSLTERQRVPTPATPTPNAVLKCLDQLRERLAEFDRVSVGFPGVIKQGITMGAFNLHPRWAGFLYRKNWKNAGISLSA